MKNSQEIKDPFTPVHTPRLKRVPKQILDSVKKEFTVEGISRKITFLVCLYLALKITNFWNPALSFLAENYGAILAASIIYFLLYSFIWLLVSTFILAIYALFLVSIRYIWAFIVIPAIEHIRAFIIIPAKKTLVYLASSIRKRLPY